MISFNIIGAGDGNRTRDRLITNQLLYRLSYTSNHASIIHNFFVLPILYINYFGFLLVLLLEIERGFFADRSLSDPVYLVLKRWVLSGVSIVPLG